VGREVCIDMLTRSVLPPTEVGSRVKGSTLFFRLQFFHGLLGSLMD
jgi:hypothetical protein